MLSLSTLHRASHITLRQALKAYSGNSRDTLRRRTVKSSTPGSEPRPQTLRHLAMSFVSPITHFEDGFAAGAKRFVLGPIIKVQSVGIINKRFDWSIFSQDHGVMIEFNVIIREALRNVGLTQNRDVVHDRSSLNQYIVDQQRVVR